MNRKLTWGGVLGVVLLLVTGVLPHVAAANGTTVVSHAATNATVATDVSNSRIANGTSITNITSANSKFASINGTPYFWRSTGQFDVRVSVDASGVYSLCLSPSPDANETATACRRFNATASNQSTTTVVTVTANNTLARASRPTFVLRNATNGTIATASIGVAAKSGDLDDDGLSNERELAVGAGVATSDTDGDNLADGTEVHQYGSDPTVADTDDDGLRDGVEVHKYGTDPTAADTDGDGLNDGVEAQSATNSTVADTDGDGLRDGVEVHKYGTDPTTADTDGDGLNDGAEIHKYSTDPTAVDTDGDGLNDGTERAYGTSPTTADTDGDGLRDATELNGDTSPTNPDTDGDGLRDGKELAVGTKPTVADSDGNGLTDGAEVGRFGTDPTAVDTDGDFLNDRTEVQLGSNPTDSLSPAWITGSILGFLAGIGVTIVATRRGWNLLSFVPAWVVPNALRSVVSSDTSSASVDAVEAMPDSEESFAAEGVDGGSATEVVARVEDELITDAELIKRMLRAESGRMHQSEIVEATDWSKAKVSRRLSTMADDGEINKVQVGRENLICLDGAVPELAVSREAPSSGGAGRLPGTAAGR